MAYGQPNTNNRQKDISRMLRARHALAPVKNGAPNKDAAYFLSNNPKAVK
jgi:hypothetical protein